MNQQVNTHVKVQFNTEFRRFGIQAQSTFTELEETLRNLFSIGQTCSLVIKFVDDEKDLVLLSSDVELHHAVALMAPLLRLVLSVPQDTSFIPSPCAEPALEKEGCKRGEWHKRGRGGRGPNCRARAPGCGQGRGSWKIDRSERLTSRILHLEKVLEDTLLPANRARAIRWRLEKLEQKLEDVKTMQSAAEVSPASQSINRSGEPVPLRACRGRGRGGHQYRKPRVDDVFEQNIQSCRTNLLAARETGDREEIKKARLLFHEAKLQMKEERVKTGHLPPFIELKIHSQRCLNNLRDAEASGDPEQVKLAREELLKAKEAVRESQRTPK